MDLMFKGGWEKVRENGGWGVHDLRCHVISFAKGLQVHLRFWQFSEG